MPTKALKKPLMNASPEASLVLRLVQHKARCARYPTCQTITIESFDQLWLQSSLFLRKQGSFVSRVHIKNFKNYRPLYIQSENTLPVLYSHEAIEYPYTYNPNQLMQWRFYSVVTHFVLNANFLCQDQSFVAVHLLSQRILSLGIEGIEPIHSTMHLLIELINSFTLSAKLNQLNKRLNDSVWLIASHCNPLSQT